MLCENCKTNQATFFYKQTKNGYTVEKNLCSSCAAAMGLGINSQFAQGNFFADDLFGEFLGGFIQPKPQIVASETCSMCGMTLSELLHGGRVGCRECYNVFRKTLMPTISKIHGNVAHCGKRPDMPEANQEKTEKTPGTADTLSQLKELLAQAIEKQEYEDAAKYRDQIRALEKEREQGKE